MRCAFLLWRFMRNVTVGKRPSSIQHSSGLQNIAEDRADAVQLSNQFRVLCQDDPAQQVAESGKIFCCGVYDEARAVHQRMLKCRSQKVLSTTTIGD